MCFMPILTQIGLKNLLASFEFDVFYCLLLDGIGELF